VDRNAIKEILGDLETRLEAYLVEWHRELGLRGVSEVGIRHTGVRGRGILRSSLPAGKNVAGKKNNV
jgi:hypothetical protein